MKQNEQYERNGWVLSSEECKARGEMRRGRWRTASEREGRLARSEDFIDEAKLCE